jgi:hypothetical protein
MKKNILTFGLISGAISSLMMVVTVPLQDKIPMDKAEIIGYTTIILSFLLVFFGVRSYRDNVAEGQITFAKAFAVGISITLISCICYVVTWEVLYYHFMPDFMDKYSAYMVNKAKASGASAAAIEAQVQQIHKYKQMYDNPLYNMAITFIEPFPIGLLITLISAIALRKKRQPVAAQAVAGELSRPERSRAIGNANGTAQSKDQLEFRTTGGQSRNFYRRTPCGLTFRKAPGRSVDFPVPAQNLSA